MYFLGNRMKQRTATNQAQLDEIADKIRGLAGFLPLVVTVTEGTKIRSTGQNARYWAEIEHFMAEINTCIEQNADFYGNTNIEMRRIAAEGMPVEHAVILFARQKEVVHEVLKQICNIPTSTRLGTKEFTKFNDILDAAMIEILGEIRGAVR